MNTPGVSNYQRLLARSGATPSQEDEASDHEEDLEDEEEGGSRCYQPNTSLFKRAPMVLKNGMTGGPQFPYPQSHREGNIGYLFFVMAGAGVEMQFKIDSPWILKVLICVDLRTDLAVLNARHSLDLSMSAMSPQKFLSEVPFSGLFGPMDCQQLRLLGTLSTSFLNWTS